MSRFFERRGPESNRRMGVLQTPALPLGYRAEQHPSYSRTSTFSSNVTAEPAHSPRDPDVETRHTTQDEAIDTRGRTRLFWDVLFTIIRGIGSIAHNVYATFGILILVGAAVALGGTYAFAELAGHVTSGATQRFDDSVLQWIYQNRPPMLEPVMLEITFLGTGTVVLMLVAVSGLFLWLSNHRFSAVLLAIATVGGLLLNNLLKFGFGRPRPQIFDWGTEVVSWSFPSGHAMSSAVVYGTVAYLAARLQKRRTHRVLTMMGAVLVILLISVSRLYLGVHYPSDVIAGVIIGLAWAGFCVASLEAFRLYARNREPEVERNETPPPAEAPAQN